MSFKDITAGTKIGKATAARFIHAGEKQTPAIEVSFEFEEPSTGTRERLAWQGWLTTTGKNGGKGALEGTMETLVERLGFNGNESFDEKTGVLTDPHVLNWKKEVQLVIEMEVNPNDSKSYPKIKWVNNLGGSMFEGCTPELIKNQLGAMGFKAAFLAAKQKAPQPREKLYEKKPDEKALPF